ncbi:RNA polymerase sigma factor [Paraeggerthella hominis]|uniref:RNA polymerase sigma factor n=1 Tax=Paraeggerthella hominis TaxID=2897351 RepID=UPI003D142A62
MRPGTDIERAIEAHGDAVWRVCGLYFRAHADAQDAFQDTFMKYALADSAAFENEEHRKAWLIRVSANVCKDMLKAAARRNVSFDAHAAPSHPVSTDPAVQPASFESEVADAMRSLDDPPRTPLYLSLYEGYTAPEIARMVDAPVNTVYSWIARGKQQLKEVLS